MNKKVLIRNNELVYYSEINHEFNCIKKDNANYVAVLEYVLNHEDDFNENEFLSILKNENADIEIYSNGKIKSDNNKISLNIIKDENEKEINKFEMPQSLIDCIRDLENNGYKFEKFEKFWEKCMNNPNPNSVMRLFDFLNAEKIKIIENGNFMAYKSVTPDFKDFYTGTIDNSIGKVVSMNREDVIYNPDEGCSYGLHCGAYEYASNYGNSDRVIVCVEVDPADVVSVPKDYNYQKIRVCKYKVVKVMEEKNKPESKSVIVNDNLDVIPKECNNTCYNINRNTKKWNDHEDSYLIMHKVDMTWNEIGKKLFRSGKSCKKRYLRLKRKSLKKV